MLLIHTNENAVDEIRLTPYDHDWSVCYISERQAGHSIGHC